MISFVLYADVAAVTHGVFRHHQTWIGPNKSLFVQGGQWPVGEGASR